jgi:Peptidase_C39 like family
MGCSACTPPRRPRASVVRHDVPPRTQYASPDLIGQIAYAGLDPAADPRWAESGATNVEDYARWCRHCCGIACLQMILTHRDEYTPPMLDLLRASLPYGTYRTQDDGTIRGLFYAPFLTYITTDHGLTGAVHPHLSLDGLRDQLERGALVLASVHKEIRRPDRPAPGRGGHLVLVTGHDPASDTLYFRNPSGHTPDSRSAELPAPTFDAFFGGRGITVATGLQHRSPAVGRRTP